MNRTDELLAAAQTVRKSAYAPYSRFAVGAAILAPSGAVYAGCNVENASFPVGTCAEAGAIAAMAAAGERRIVEILVIGGDGFTPPCGACRQRIHEFADGDTRIVLAHSSGARRIYSCEDLLPHSFALTPPDAG